jgi:hypothetical protein
MALKECGKYRYGESQADLRAEVLRDGEENAYPSHQFADCLCACGGKRFRLSLDDAEGAGVRTCVGCDCVHPIGDSDEYLEEADQEECACRVAARSSRSPSTCHFTRAAKVLALRRLPLLRVRADCGLRRLEERVQRLAGFARESLARRCQRPNASSGSRRASLLHISLSRGLSWWERSDPYHGFTTRFAGRGGRHLCSGSP